MVSARILASLLAVAMLAGGAQMASAQFFYDDDDDHHHHDAYGHRVDDDGHHIDNHGHHSGSYGVYDDDHPHEHYYRSYRPNYYAPSHSHSIAPNALPRAAQPIYYGEPIKIQFPASLEGSVNYELNGHEYTIRTGEAQSIQSDRSWTIAFDRGGSFGLARYSLSPGMYEFSATDRGWELHKKRPSAAASPVPPAPPAPPAPVSATP